MEDCIVRIWNNEDHEAIIFFPDRDANPGMINSWMWIGQHGEALVKIMTKPVTRRATERETLEAVKLYENCYVCKLRPIQRTNYKRLVKNWDWARNI